MYPNILNENQQALLPFIQSFAKEYYLVGGTAIALQIGHRQSIDFDLFKKTPVHRHKIAERLKKFDLAYRLLFADDQSFHILVRDVKITFFQYPFEVPATKRFEKIPMPDLLHLAAMKAYALGRRAKWKDYLDLYFLFQSHHTLQEVSDRAKDIFGGLFSPKLFKQQLCYFADIDYTEEVVFLTEPVSEQEIQQGLIQVATA